MPDPAVPPTPPVPLSALLAREDLGLRQIAGPADRATAVHWAHTSEMADPYPYLLGGELLLTAGVHIPEAAGSGTYFDDYVSRIVEAGGAALGFGLAPVHDTVPRALVEACDSYELPLLEVPPRTTFSGVARAVWQLMAQARHAELRRVTEAQQSLASAASRPDPVRAVLRQLAQRVEGWAVLYGPEGTEVAAAGRRPGGAAAGRGPRGGAAGVPGRGQRDGAAGRRAQDPASESSAKAPQDEAAGRSPQDTPAGSPARTSPAPVAGRGPRNPVSGPPAQAPPRPVAGQPAQSPATGSPSHRPQDDSAHYNSPEPQDPAATSLAALAQVVRPAGPGTPTSAADTAAGTHLAAYALGAGQGFVLGVAAPRRDPGDHTIASVAAVLLSLLTGEHQSGSGAARSSALVRLLLGAEPEAVAPLLGGDRRFVVHGRPDGQPCDAVAASALGAALGSPLVDLARDVVRVLVPADREPSPQPGWTLGVSAPATAPDWPSADAQAARALARATATRTPLHRHGTHRPGLTELLSPEAAETHARTLLAPLAPPLTETLRTWLSLHGSWDRTAVALSVHRNTVRQRIARCAALLGTDLDDPDVRMELWFALRHVEA
ncbi:PucR family transcriptional regulator ligand-binding domain-containing protein [Streptomyces sp. NPDC098781]|uniref:PucR family transcriptional regulator n=1 Tax=Streptomyces sp. NPDC098781 TaxID=3366097 RepID=UPI0038104D69